MQPSGGRDEIPERHPPSLLPAGTAAVWEVSPRAWEAAHAGLERKRERCSSHPGKARRAQHRKLHKESLRETQSKVLVEKETV